LQHVFQKYQHQTSPDRGRTDRANFPNTMSTWIPGLTAGENRQLKETGQFTVSGQRASYIRDTYGIGFAPCEQAVLSVVGTTATTTPPIVIPPPVVVPPGLCDEIKKLVASDGVNGDTFGKRAAISGDFTIIGTFDTESAYLFGRDKGGTDNWGEVIELTASDTAPDDGFGEAIAIGDDFAIVGAPFNDDAGSNSGSAYIFEKDFGGTNVWDERIKLVAVDAAADDRFGTSVAINGDFAIVGAPRDDVITGNTGSVYIFGRNEGGPDAWGVIAKINASDAAISDEFGTSVAISGDTIIVGTPLNDDAGASSGSAYIFNKDEGGLGAWGEVAKLVASDADSGDQFGGSVAINGDFAVVGAGQNDDAGSNSGSAYIFEKDKGGPDSWDERKKLVASDADASDQFGLSVGVSGETVIVGARLAGVIGDGQAYIFEKDEDGVDNWGETLIVTSSEISPSSFGESVGISGDTIIIGDDDLSFNKGAAYIFEPC